MYLIIKFCFCFVFFFNTTTDLVPTHQSNNSQAHTFKRCDERRIAEYLGFCHKHVLSPLFGEDHTWPLNLSLYLQPAIFLEYVSFLCAKGAKGVHVRKVAVCAANVVSFLAIHAEDVVETDAQLLEEWKVSLKR